MLNQTVVISGDVLAQEVSGEMVLLDLKGEQYLGLNEVGARIWKSLQQGETLKMIYEVLLLEYDVEDDVLKRDMEKIISEMEEAGIITVSQG